MHDGILDTRKGQIRIPHDGSVIKKRDRMPKGLVSPEMDFSHTPNVTASLCFDLSR